MRIREVESFSDFIALKKDWTSLLARTNNSVFSTWEWLSLWWKHFGTDRKLLILLAEEDDKLLGIAPFMYSIQKRLGLRLAKLEFIGTPTSDYNEFILAEKDVECIKLFTDYIVNDFPEKWDCIGLEDIPENSRSLAIIDLVPKNVKLRSVRILHECPYIPLPKSFDIFYKQLGSKLRKNLRRSQKQLQQRHRLELKDYSGVQSFKEGMERMFELHQKRWTAKGESGAFADAKICDFHLEVAGLFSKLGWLSLNSLVADERSVALSYGFIYNSKMYYYLTGIDPVYNRYSVGNLLILGILEKCVADKLAEFDFLRGAELYKTRWSPLRRKNFNLIFTKDKFFSWMHNSLIEKYWFFGNKLEHSLKKL